MQAVSTAGVVGDVGRADVAYNVRLAPPRPPGISNVLPPAENPNSTRAVQNSTSLNIGLQIPTPPIAAQLRSTVGKLGGDQNPGSSIIL